ncbi:L-threonine ammonia-lyase-like [Ptychodera flava]|uniref:L-threonine ammonia-lyase-like n=1 Tax=Ptychodera flava TaxID=63121 RepID=UPI00396A042C
MNVGGPVDVNRYRNSIVEAYKRIFGYVRKTPLDLSPVLSSRTGAKVYLKLESEQVTGAFKARGAFNKLSILCNRSNSTIKERGLITSSSGNHGIACAYAGQMFDFKTTVYVPVYVSEAKETTLKRYGANIIKHGTDCVDTETTARRKAQVAGIEFISPYNDDDVICGQGTAGLEIHEELPDVDAIFVSVGGGGMISGIASYLKAVKPTTQIIGCQPETNHVMDLSIKAGEILDIESEDTISDGTAGGVEENSVTFDICKSCVDKWVLVSEDEISEAVYFMIEHHHKIVETAAALTVAAFLKTAEEYKSQNVVLVISGSNISVERVKWIMDKHYKS